MNLDELKHKLLGLDKPMERWHSDKTRSYPVPSKLDLRKAGQDHPVHGYTMIGQIRLDSLHKQLEDIRNKQIPGDLIECGVWRGGACMFMAAFCQEYGIDKTIYVADSFEGLPTPKLAPDANMQDHLHEHLQVSVEQVMDGFAELGISTHNVVPVKGWFKDTLPSLRDEQWALIRADGDMYESTMDILKNLYHGLQSGGYMVIDDYGCVVPCRQAVDEFRQVNNITEELFTVDWTCKAWRRR